MQRLHVPAIMSSYRIFTMSKGCQPARRFYQPLSKGSRYSLISSLANNLGTFTCILRSWRCNLTLSTWHCASRNGRYKEIGRKLIQRLMSYREWIFVFHKQFSHHETIASLEISLWWWDLAGFNEKQYYGGSKSHDGRIQGWRCLCLIIKTETVDDDDELMLIRMRWTMSYLATRWEDNSWVCVPSTKKKKKNHRLSKFPKWNWTKTINSIYSIQE